MSTDFSLDNPDEDNVTLLTSMGFCDVAEVQRALKLAKGDVNEALSYLTNETPGLYDIDMPDAGTSADVDSSLEFPTTHLYELESRVFTTNWSIPYGKHESLARCLNAAVDLAKEGLSDSDENCKRFVEQCLPACFEKLLTSNALYKWGPEVHEGVFNMLVLLVDLIATRLSQKEAQTLPFRLLEVLGQVFDPHCDFHQKNKNRNWDRPKWEAEFGVDKCYAIPTRYSSFSFSSSNHFGYLVNLINRFAVKEGFQSVARLFESDQLNCQDMHLLLFPFANCADYLNPDVVGPVLLPCVNHVKQYINEISETQLKKPSSNNAVDALCSAKLLSLALTQLSSCDPTADYDVLRLDVILRFLKASNFSSRMQALREVSKLLEWLSNSKFEKIAISADVVSEWLTKNQVLSLALEGNIDQAQYCDRLKTLLEFVGPQLGSADIAKIWQLQKNRTAVTVDNLNIMIAQAAVKFQEKELGYLFSLIEKDWSTETSRGRERLLQLVGRIGKDTTQSKTYTKALDLLWRWLHEPNIHAALVVIALQEHMQILSVSGREAERNEYIMRAVEDIKKRRWVVRGLCYIDTVVRQSPKASSMSSSSSSYSFSSSKSSSHLRNFLEATEFPKVLCECLVERHRMAVEQFADKRNVTTVTPTLTPISSPFKAPLSAPIASTVAIQVSIPSPPSFVVSTTASNQASPSNDAAGAESSSKLELDADFVMDNEDGFTYGEVLKIILDFLKFAFEESNVVLNLPRAREIWEALIDDPRACSFEREMGLEWFLNSVQELHENARVQIFSEKILKLDATSISRTGFRCFRKYFEVINGQSRNVHRITGGPMTVENTSLVGVDYLWQIIVCCTDDYILNEAIKLLMDISWRNLTEKLKKDWEVLHRKFLGECYKRLENAGASLNLEGCVVPRLLQDVAKMATAPCVPTMAMASFQAPERWLKIRNIERVLLLALQYIRVVDEQQNGLRYQTPHAASFYGRPFVLTCTVDINQLQNIKELQLWVHENELLASVRERAAERLKLETRNNLVIELNGSELKKTDDQLILNDLRINAKSCLNLKTRFSGFTFNSSAYDSGSSFGSKFSSQLEKERSPSIMMASDNEVFAMLYNLQQLNEECISRRVRDLLLAIPSDKTVEGVLESLGTPAESGTSSKSNSLERLKKSTGLLGSDKSLSTKDSGSKATLAVASGSKSKAKSGSSIASVTSTALGTAVSSAAGGEDKANSGPVNKLRALFEANSATGISAFRVLYNLEILFGKLLPTFYDQTTVMTAQNFCKDFLAADGLNVVLAILHKDFLPSSTAASLRLDIYERVLQILQYCLVDQSAMAEIIANEAYLAGTGNASNDINAQQKPDVEMPSADTTGVGTVGDVTTSAVASSASLLAPSTSTAATASSGLRPSGALEHPHCNAIKTISESEFMLLLENLQRLSWAAAGGFATSLASELLSPQGPSFAGLRHRTSESSTGSSCENEPPSSLHSAVWHGHALANETCVSVCIAAFRLMIESALQRPADLLSLFRLPHLNEFLVDLLLVSDSAVLRQSILEDLLRLSFVDLNSSGGSSFHRPSQPHPSSSPPANFRKMILRSQGNASDCALTEVGEQSGANNNAITVPSVRFRLLQILLRAPVPLWTSSCAVRSMNQRLLSQCSEYFKLRGQLIEELLPSERLLLQPSLTEMLQTEINWLLGFSCSTQQQCGASDNAALAAHMDFMGRLLKLQPKCKQEVGHQLIRPLLNDFLFPAAKIILDGGSQHQEATLRQTKAANMRAKCQVNESRLAAFQLLIQLSDQCSTNFQHIATILAQLHHQYSPELTKEWDYMPLVDHKMEAGLVGLKNAGATCYMNSVLQQFYMTPGLADAVLSVEGSDGGADSEGSSLFCQLQTLFANLMESELQYFTPSCFWDCFRLWGQKINTREQQDAFEFYSELIEQMDEQAKLSGNEEVFRKNFQGVFSDQKICDGCPHRYEREETFYALNVSVRAQNLEESLNQFTKGEILSGENAYFCEKCEVKRTTLKRMCVKTLPPVLVIHLKRFEFDFEENRALKFNDELQFPLDLEMFPYTSAGLCALESDSDCFSSPAVVGVSSSNALSAVNSPAMASSPLSRKISSNILDKRRSAVKLSAGCRDGTESLYALVGVVVHSGQANAGHYYAFIKDRRGTPMTNKSHGKWFKFNDTTVEEIEFTHTFMECELFGGKYKAKADKNSLFPEERERYWNAYMLFYERVRNKEVRLRPASKRSVAFGFSLSADLGASPTSSLNESATTNTRHDSLMELTELVQAGERQNLFSEAIPSRIRQQIREENLRFARNRDIYNLDYGTFVSNLVQVAIKPNSERTLEDIEAVPALEFALKFLLNTWWHTRRSLRGDVHAWTRTLESLLQQSAACCAWFVQFLASSGGSVYLCTFLLECESFDVRNAFGAVLRTAFEAHLSTLCFGDASFDRLIGQLLQLLEKAAIDNWQRASVYFQLLHHYVQSGGVTASAHVLQKNGFGLLLNFMLQYPTNALGVVDASSFAASESTADAENLSMPSIAKESSPLLSDLSSSPLSATKAATLSRRWNIMQSRDFGPVYNTLALLILHCNVEPARDTLEKAQHDEDCVEYLPKVVTRQNLMQMPKDMEVVVFGPLSSAFVKELVWALSNVENTSDALSDLVLCCSWRNKSFSKLVMKEVLFACAQNVSNELKHVLALIESILSLSDELRVWRTEILLDGIKERPHNAPGLLATIRSACLTDSRRTYNCIKFLVAAHPQSEMLKQALLHRLEDWEWSVEWLKKTMHESGGSGSLSSSGGGSGSQSFPSVTFGPLPATSSVSNEDSNTRTFQRTVSAQLTLDQATQLLSELQDVTMDIANDDDDSNGASLATPAVVTGVLSANTIASVPRTFTLTQGGSGDASSYSSVANVNVTVRSTCTAARPPLLSNPDVAGEGGKSSSPIGTAGNAPNAFAARVCPLPPSSPRPGILNNGPPKRPRALRNDDAICIDIDGPADASAGSVSTNAAAESSAALPAHSAAQQSSVSPIVSLQVPLSGASSAVRTTGKKDAKVTFNA